MKEISNKIEAEAYVSGVLHGDGWCTKYSLGMRVKDKDFSEAFANALNQVFSFNLETKVDERGYWLVRKSNRSGRFSHLKNKEIKTTDEIIFWLRGLFDSEGNASIFLHAGTANCYSRRISMYSTNTETLQKAVDYLAILKIPSAFRGIKNSVGHKGTKPMYELLVKAGQQNYKRFLEIIGSNIERKRETMKDIVKSYVPNLSESCRNAQLKGAATKRNKRMNETLPRVIKEMQKLKQTNNVLTYKVCANIKGYLTLLKHFTHKQLIEKCEFIDG